MTAAPGALRRGLFFGPFDGLASPQAAAELAAAAERAGWDGVFVWDHLLYAEPVREIADPWITLAAIACATSRVVIGPMVTPLPRRRPAIVAKQAVTLDRLSGGRLVLGFGIGDDGRERELSGFGEETGARARGEMLTEGLEVLTGLLAGDRVEHRGPRYTVDGVRFLPAPQRASGIPIWLAARWPNRAPVRRAARYDGLFPIGLPAPDDLHEMRAWVAAEGGERAGYDYVLCGPPDADPEPWGSAGATWFLTQIGPYGIDYDAAMAIATAGPAGCAEVASR